MKYATGKYALALCDRCGQQYDYVVLRKEWNNLRVCPDCYEEKHPQLEPDPPPYEPQALFEPRPDRKESLEILVGQKTFPLINNISTQGIGAVGIVTTTDVAFDSTTADVSGVLGASAVGTVTIDTDDTASVTGLAGTSAVGSVTISANITTYTVTVATGTNSYGTGNKFYIDGSVSPTLTLTEGNTYRFDQSDSSNSTHPLRFSTTANGTHGGGSEYTTGVTTNGTPGSSGAYTQITVASGAPTLYYYCTNHSGMGGQANTS